MARVNFKIEGMDKLQKDLKKLGAVPQKHVTAAAKKGMTPVLKAAQANSPYETGALEKGMVLKGEKAKPKGRKIYRVVFDRQYNDIFQKRNKQGKIVGYYPVSMEYGFHDKNGVFHWYSMRTGWVAKFTHDALERNKGRTARTIITTMSKKINEELAKAGLKG